MNPFVDPKQVWRQQNACRDVMLGWNLLGRRYPQVGRLDRRLSSGLRETQRCLEYIELLSRSIDQFRIGAHGKPWAELLIEAAVPWRALVVAQSLFATLEDSLIAMAMLLTEAKEFMLLDGVFQTRQEVLGEIKRCIGAALAVPEVEGDRRGIDTPHELRFFEIPPGEDGDRDRYQKLLQIRNIIVLHQDMAADKEAIERAMRAALTTIGRVSGERVRSSEQKVELASATVNEQKQLLGQMETFVMPFAGLFTVARAAATVCFAASHQALGELLNHLAQSGDIEGQ